ncbi:MAG: alpha/beta hydrolase, partial [Planctomycetota bacterium]
LGPRYHHPAPLQDVRRAIRTVRARAKDHSIDPTRIGVLGFSAGGHLAASASTMFEAGDKSAKDPIERVSSRPDFAVLCYPVITFKKPHGHAGSGRNLLGPDASEEQLDAMSLQKRVTKDTPPTFLFHTSEDTGVPPENSLFYYLALREHGVPAELHVFEKGRHGVGLAKGMTGTSDWPERCREWLEVRGIIPSKEVSR